MLCHSENLEKVTAAEDVNKICHFFQKDACSKGADCPFVHVKDFQPPQVIENAFEEIEDIVLCLEEYDSVRLSRIVSQSIMERARAMYLQYGVTMERLSSLGLVLRGSPDALDRCRRSLNAVANLQEHIGLSRLIRERCRFITTIAEELDVARELWFGRRVMVCESGTLVHIKDLRISQSDGSILVLTCPVGDSTAGTPITLAERNSSEITSESSHTASTSAHSEIDARSLVLWDSFGMADGVSVVHIDHTNDELSEAFAHRLFKRFGRIESVEITARLAPNLIVSKVIFDISRNPEAPSRAVAGMSGVCVDGCSKPITVLVSAPKCPIHVRLKLPTTVQIAGDHTEDAIRTAFGSDSVRRVKHVRGQGGNVTLVLFHTAEMALTARRKPPSCFAGVYHAIRDRGSTLGQ